MHKLLVMGVSGCGKSTVAARLATALRGTLIEGDDHHPESNQAKMRAGIALDDADRAPWLDRLGALLAASEGNVVLTCSALKREYRDRLRAVEPALAIVFIHIEMEAARARVAARTSHLFPASLVANQFKTLEPPTEGGAAARVLRIEALWPLERQADTVLRWLGHASHRLPRNPAR